MNTHVKAFVAANILSALPALASPSFHLEPGIALTEYRLGSRTPIGLGVGPQGVMDFGSLHPITIDLAVYGSLVGAASPNPGQALSVAPLVCHRTYGCAGIIFDLASTNGGILKGFTWKQNFGFMLGTKFDSMDLLHFVFGGA